MPKFCSGQLRHGLVRGEWSRHADRWRSTRCCCCPCERPYARARQHHPHARDHKGSNFEVRTAPAQTQLGPERCGLLQTWPGVGNGPLSGRVIPGTYVVNGSDGSSRERRQRARSPSGGPREHPGTRWLLVRGTRWLLRRGSSPGRWTFSSRLSERGCVRQRW